MALTTYLEAIRQGIEEELQREGEATDGSRVGRRSPCPRPGPAGR